MGHYYVCDRCGAHIKDTIYTVSIRAQGIGGGINMETAGFNLSQAFCCADKMYCSDCVKLVQTLLQPIDKEE